MSKTVFVTGATSGFGRAIAGLFAANGCNVIINGRRQELLNELESELRGSYNVEIMKLPFDVRYRDEVSKAIESLPQNWHNIDILVNNAGLAAGLSDIQDGDLDDWDAMIDTNVKGLLYVSKAIMPYMIARKSGHIINISSIAGREVYPKGNVYCASKHAVDALSKGMRTDLLVHNIKVTNINPGLAETEFSIVRFKGDRDRAAAVYKGFEPLHAEDIAQAVLYVSTLPAHVNINELVIVPTVQANSRDVVKEL